MCRVGLWTRNISLTSLIFEVPLTDLSRQVLERSIQEPVEVSHDEHRTEIFHTMREAVSRLQKDYGWPLGYSSFTQRMAKAKENVWVTFNHASTQSQWAARKVTQDPAPMLYEIRVRPRSDLDRLSFEERSSPTSKQSVTSFDLNDEANSEHSTAPKSVPGMLLPSCSTQTSRIYLTTRLLSVE